MSLIVSERAKPEGPRLPIYEGLYNERYVLEPTLCRTFSKKFTVKEMKNWVSIIDALSIEYCFIY